MKFHLNRKKDVMGPHSLDVIAVLVGTLLGDSFGEKRNEKSRIHLQQESHNQEYLNWVHQFLASRGYCHISKPKTSTRIGKHGKLRYILRLRTFSYGSFNWLIDSFYPQEEKRLPNPKILKTFLTPLALTIWICDDGTRAGSGLRLCTNCFTKEEVQVLCHVLQELYSITATPQKTGLSKKTEQIQYHLYIHKKSMEKVKYLVSPWMVPSMCYKLGT